MVIESTRPITDPQEAYAEALKLIEEAKKRGAHSLATGLRAEVRGGRFLGGLKVLPPEISEVQSLRSVIADGTELVDISPLARLAHLHTLQLQHTKVSNLRPIETLSDLRLLFLDDTAVTDIGPLSALQELRTLS